jgi:hypothetical protein
MHMALCVIKIKTNLILAEFNIEEKLTKATAIWIFNFLIFIVGSAILIHTGGNPYNLWIFMAVLLILNYVIVHHFPYRNLAGKIVFKNEGLEIKKKGTLTIKYDQISEFKLFYTLRRGVYYKHLDLGNNNRLEIKQKNETIIVFICIRTKKEEKKLKSLLLKLYEFGVNINESISDEKTYGLEFLNYKEIQEFKSKYLNK